MKLFLNKENTKRIMVLIIIVTLFNFISPTVSQAFMLGILEDIGGILFQPVATFLCTIADLVLTGLQKYFIGYDEIGYIGPEDAEISIFYIKYSPGIIFSNKVAGLKTNFINATEEDEEKYVGKKLVFEHFETRTLDKYSTNPVASTFKGIYDQEKDDMNFLMYTKPEINDGEFTEIDYIYRWKHGNTNYYAIQKDVQVTLEDYIEIILRAAAYTRAIRLAYTALGAVLGYLIGVTLPTMNPFIILGVMIVFTVLFLFIKTESTAGKIEIYKIKEKTVQGEVQVSNALVIKPIISKWYKALRAIALVGLLSVLVYIGIRILISSTARRKS